MKTDRAKTLWLALSGLTAALPTVFSSLSFLAFVSFLPALFLLFDEWRAETPRFRPKHYYGAGLVFCMPYFIVVFHWFSYLYPLDFVSGMTPAGALGVILAACVGLPLLQSLGYAFLFFMMAWLSRAPLVRRAPILLPFLFASGWSLFAFTQTLTWAGVPWGTQLALSQYGNLWFLSSASLFGSYFVTFLIAAINGLLAYALLRLRDGRRQHAACAAFLALALFIGNTGLSTVVYLIPAAKTAPVRAAVLQGNIGSAQKWDPSSNAYDVYEQLAIDAAADGAELIVWPETVINTFVEYDYPSAYLKKVALETGTIQIVGCYSRGCAEDGTPLRYNTLRLVYPDGTIAEEGYAKRHLVPFGEYVPMERVIRTLLPFLANINMLSDPSTPGDGSHLFTLPEGRIGGLVCFDSIYEELARVSVADGAELLALGTNDSWFFDSAAVSMHNEQAVLRAVENGRCVLRAANTGISSIISEKGEILGSLPALTRGYFVADVSYVNGRTLYNRIGNLFLILCQIFFLLPLILPVIGKIRIACHRKRGTGRK